MKLPLCNILYVRSIFVQPSPLSRCGKSLFTCLTDDIIQRNHFRIHPNPFTASLLSQLRLLRRGIGKIVLIPNALSALRSLIWRYKRVFKLKPAPLGYTIKRTTELRVSDGNSGISKFRPVNFARINPLFNQICSLPSAFAPSR